MLKTFSLVAIGALCIVAPRAKADAWNQKTTITFNEPVEVPGRVLPAGTYVFKLADAGSDRDVVQVFNKDGTQEYGTFLAIPDYRLKPKGKPVITFEERAARSPEAVKAWFYPGDSYGHEFVYPKTKAQELAKAHQQPVPSMPDELSGNLTKPAKTTNDSSVTAMKNAPLRVEQPGGQEVTVVEIFELPPNHTHEKK